VHLTSHHVRPMTDPLFCSVAGVRPDAEVSHGRFPSVRGQQTILSRRVITHIPRPG
jgi:hypothetical protein